MEYGSWGRLIVRRYITVRDRADNNDIGPMMGIEGDRWKEKLLYVEVMEGGKEREREREGVEELFGEVRRGGGRRCYSSQIPLIHTPSFSLPYRPILLSTHTSHHSRVIFPSYSFTIGEASSQ